MLDRLATAMIDRLGLTDGDPEIEANGDELYSSRGEDDYCDHSPVIHQLAPDCPISDPDWGVDDEG